jgi:hypothetical protein
MAELEAMGASAVPDLLRAVTSASGRPAPDGYEDGIATQITPALLRRVRSLEVLRRMGGAAESALPVLLDALQRDREVWIGNLIETISYLPPIDSDGNPVGSLRENPMAWRATMAACEAQIVQVHAPVLSVIEGADGWRVRAAPRSVMGRLLATMGSHWCLFDGQAQTRIDGEQAIHRWELVAARARRLGPGSVSRDCAAGIQLRLARYYPPDQSLLAATRRDLTAKISPRFLDTLADAVIVLRPEACALGHVHWLETSAPGKRQAAARALGRLGPKARAAVPWLADLARSGRPVLAREAIVVLGLIGPDASASLPVLRELIQSPLQGEQAALARAAIRRIGNDPVR